jgi:hypothetical protein
MAPMRDDHRPGELVAKWERVVYPGRFYGLIEIARETASDMKPNNR